MATCSVWRAASPRRSRLSTAQVDSPGRHKKFQTGHILMSNGHYRQARDTAHRAPSLGTAYPLGHRLASEGIDRPGRFGESVVDLDLATSGQVFNGRDSPPKDGMAKHVRNSLGQRSAEADLRALETRPKGQFFHPRFAPRSVPRSASGRRPCARCATACVCMTYSRQTSAYKKKSGRFGQILAS